MQVYFAIWCWISKILMKFSSQVLLWKQEKTLCAQDADSQVIYGVMPHESEDNSSHHVGRPLTPSGWSPAHRRCSQAHCCSSCSSSARVSLAALAALLRVHSPLEHTGCPPPRLMRVTGTTQRSWITEGPGSRSTFCVFKWERQGRFQHTPLCSDLGCCVGSPSRSKLSKFRSLCATGLF